MKSRRLLQESTNPSLCAFCAHRLGQNGGPAQINRRFLQSSRPVSKPPGEAAAVREVGDNGGQTDAGFSGSWGGMSNSSSRSVLAPTWGSSGGIPAGTAFGTWGRPAQEARGIPMRSRDSAVITSQGSMPKNDDLLPHERAARQMIMRNAAKEEQRAVSINSGPGPQSTRAGRPSPFSEDERMDRRRRSTSRQGVILLNERRERALDGYGPRITKHAVRDPEPKITMPHSRDLEPRITKPTISDLESKDTRRALQDADSKIQTDAPHESEPRITKPVISVTESETEKLGTSQWSQLRRRGRNNNQQLPELKVSRSNEDRGRREEEAKAARYTPLTSRSIPLSRNYLSDWTTYGASAARSSASSAREASDMSTISQNPPELVSWKAQEDTTNSASQSVPRDESQVPVTFSVEKGMERPESRSDRPKKNRVRRGSDTAYATFEDAPKGKDRDKARRRQQFASGEEEISEEATRRAEEKRLRKLEKAARKAAAPTPILLPEYISISNLAAALKVKLELFVQKMEELGFEETSHDHILNGENAGLIAQEYNFEPIIDRGESEDLKAREPAKDPSKLPPRPPVVTIMGHVDHGKTTLLDWLRKSSVAASEHGGITQHIGAFSVSMPSGKIVTFLDTPGHSAFLSMRQRGANVTDIVILVVAADDSVKPQTIEAINHAKTAKVPIIVAINKIDKEQADINRVKLDLARHGVDVEDFGGDTQVVCVSGKTGQGMEELEEAAVTLSEILDMRAERSGPAEGWVLEASIKSRGKVATVLVRRGTMRPGDFIVAGKTWARIRCLRNEAGVEIPKAGPGTPVEIDGWREQPEAGDEVLQAPDEAKAKSVVEYRVSKEERDRMAQDMEAINEIRRTEQEKRSHQKAEQAAAAAAKKAANEDIALPPIPESKPNGPKEVFIIIKADVSGSVEAVLDSITALGTGEVRPHVLRSGVGQLSEFDVEHAAAAKGVLVNFNTAIEPHIARLAEENKVPIVDANIIYKLVDDVKAELSKYLPPLVSTRVLGEAEVAQIFSINVKGRVQKAVAGCKVRNGTVGRLARVRVLRGVEKVFDGTISSLKNVKKDVPDVKKGGECGIGFEGFTDFQVGDQVQAYEEIVEKRFL